MHAASASNGSCQITQGVVGPGKAAASGKFRGKSGERNTLEGVEVEFLGSVVDVNAHDVTFRAEVNHQAFRNLAGIRAGPGIQVDIERVGLGIIMQFHLFSFQDYHRLIGAWKARSARGWGMAAFATWAIKARRWRTSWADVILRPPIDRTSRTEYSMDIAGYGERLGKQSG